MTAPDLARYFLHMRDGTFIEDPDGTALPNLEAARRLALDSARELWMDAIMTERDLSDATFEIMDSTGKLLTIIPLTDALPRGLRARLRSG